MTEEEKRERARIEKMARRNMVHMQPESKRDPEITEMFLKSIIEVEIEHWKSKQKGEESRLDREGFIVKNLG